jgi:hypothetical protein
MRNNLSDISATLIINGTFTCSPGLIDGKMGIAVFFFHYARHTGLSLYEDYACDLIEEIQNQLHNNFDPNYFSGLSGIGTGIEYLALNGFIDTDTDILLEDIDNRIFHAIHNVQNPSLELYSGIIGWGRYLLYRIQLKHSKHTIINATAALQKIIDIIRLMPFGQISDTEKIDTYCFLHDIITTSNFQDKPTDLKEIYRQGINGPFSSSILFPRLKDALARDMATRWLSEKYFETDTHYQISCFINSKWQHTTNIYNGYAALGLFILATMNKSNLHWIQLL